MRKLEDLTNKELKELRLNRIRKWRELKDKTEAYYHLVDEANSENVRRMIIKLKKSSYSSSSTAKKKKQ